MTGKTLGIIGSGDIARAIRDRVGTTRTISLDAPATLAACAAVVSVTDCWDTSAHDLVRAAAQAAQVPWLPIHTEISRAVVGPLEVTGTPGCGTCTETRRRRTRKDPSGWDAVRERNSKELATVPPRALTALAAEFVAELVDDEWRRLTDAEPMRIHRGIVIVELADLSFTTHSFLPDPLCSTCGSLRPDDPELAAVAIGSVTKLAPKTYRVRDVHHEFDALRALYVDPECGLISEFSRGNEGGLAVAAAPFGLRGGGTERGWGRTANYRSSELIALLEALERHGGLYPGGKRTVVRSSFRQIASEAVDPRQLALHPAESYRRPDFGFEQFDDTRIYPWVWGYSFMRQAPILVPESYAYYRAPRRDEDPRPFLYEISNGCALGGCLEEAILYGILETVERDAFLMTWYA
ncbi:TOMM precursor leader peptide-binding protein, partial [Nocardia sp. NPDC058497]|uniref:TOMM precursor leader peptide-binding protein n=1 Tax=Nocardia sp. NPDC058497 TaxID=3346529 RepID=UPI00366422F5